MLRDGPRGALARHLLRCERMLSHGGVSVAVAHDEPIDRSALVSGERDLRLTHDPLTS